MRPFPRLMAAEGLKLRRSPAARLVWLLPMLFIALEFWFFERSSLRLKVVTPEFRNVLDQGQVRLVVNLWSGFFQPLAVALLPALLFKPEHRFRTWRHLHAMPLPRRQFYLAKSAWTLLLSAGMLGLVALLLLLERRVLGVMNPLLVFPFHGLRMIKVMAWLWLGSLPVLALYLWISDRISSLAVPIVFGTVGLILTISLSGQELDRAWRRDLIPWILPYACAERVIHSDPGQQDTHMGGSLFKREPNVLRLPNGRKVKTWQNVPDEVLFPPPAPSPAWLLASFAASAGLLLLGLGWLDAGRARVR